jgi:hypothetical protein
VEDVMQISIQFEAPPGLENAMEGIMGLTSLPQDQVVNRVVGRLVDLSKCVPPADTDTIMRVFSMEGLFEIFPEIREVLAKAGVRPDISADDLARDVSAVACLGPLLEMMDSPDYRSGNRMTDDEIIAEANRLGVGAPLPLRWLAWPSMKPAMLLGRSLIRRCRSTLSRPTAKCANVSISGLSVGSLETTIFAGRWRWI